MGNDIKLGSIWGIPIGLHVSWFLIFALLTWSLATGYFPGAYPQLSSPSHWLLGVLTSLLFFGSVLAHELGHSFIALRNQIPVKGITLFIFGGVAQIAQEPRSPGEEFRIAIAGPLASLGLAGLFASLWLLDQRIPFLAAPSEYLLRINLILALFNLIPGFPLDGGRVLRALVWWWTKSYSKANQVAAASGQVVAFGFIALGVYTIFTGRFFDGLWLVFIGFFLQNAASSARVQTSLQESLRGITVRQVMSRECIQVPSLTPISQLVEQHILNGGHRCFFVADNGQIDGMLTLQDITRVPQPRWGFTTTRQAMTPLSKLATIEPHAELLSALKVMDSSEAAQLPVLEGDRLVGMLSRESILHYLRTRADIGV